MTKVEAIRKLMEDRGGSVTWQTIYNNIEQYYPAAKSSQEWQAGIRGVLYREIKNGRNFKKIGFGIFALKE
jgi:DNA-directed RNA polymerase delta subunit